MILAATSRGEEMRREREWKRDGIEREGGAEEGRTKRMDDGCSLAPALPSVHQGSKSLCRSEERMWGGWRGRRGTRGGNQDERRRTDKMK